MSQTFYGYKVCSKKTLQKMFSFSLEKLYTHNYNQQNSLDSIRTMTQSRNNKQFYEPKTMCYNFSVEHSSYNYI